MCRPYSCSNGEGWNSGTSTRCSSCPGAICSQAAGAALFRGRPIGVQPRTSWKKAVDRASSQVARVLPRQERSSQTGNHGTTPPYGRELPPGTTRKGEVDSDSLFRVFRWIPWLISNPPGAAIGCCWTESTVRICADLGCLGNNVCQCHDRAPFPSGIVHRLSLSA